MRRAWQPTPVFFPGKSHGQRSLGGYSPWGLKESDTTEATEQACSTIMYVTVATATATSSTTTVITAAAATTEYKSKERLTLQLLP